MTTTTHFNLHKPGQMKITDLHLCDVCGCYCAGHMFGFQKLDKHRRLTGTGKICGPCNLEKIKALLARKNEEHVPQ